MSTRDGDMRSDIGSGLARGIGRVGWQGIALPIRALLTIVEPVARFVLTAAALLGILMSVLFELSGVAPRFPFWLVFGMSLGCGLLVIVLNAVMRRLGAQ